MALEQAADGVAAQQRHGREDQADLQVLHEGRMHPKHREHQQLDEHGQGVAGYDIDDCLRYDA